MPAPNEKPRPYVDFLKKPHPYAHPWQSNHELYLCNGSLVWIATQKKTGKWPYSYVAFPAYDIDGKIISDTFAWIVARESYEKNLAPLEEGFVQKKVPKRLL